ncbi:MAG: tRNA pseudouridine(38-40) synthase TruA [Deltaproteobacteria bacterium]|nr:tRNA pseudouridine(38-40) synthase TruA [Deltaproteobacteria bacterium]MDP7157955.1 tRNA pseudouridine(38-40) synthase TruA [SAR324 cluster bacterium]MDP7317884.1 tRNA pseudouridine(38-40) synthase TruA [SAR324 cluster bacterium]MDP7464029.1 tRNA pseudouridine(38-40) synthase TruA [SAR324 cluster bacterium]
MPSSQNWLILLAYSGTCYRGWQIQPHDPTIEGLLEHALLELTGQSVKVHGAGRTDAGVHALNYPASFQLDTCFSAEKWRGALNSKLPEDVVVKHVQPMPLEFHARHSAVGKHYRYLIHNCPYADPFGPNSAWWVRRSLDVAAMREAATRLVGIHDFSAFRSVRCASPNPVKELRELQVELDPSQPGRLWIEAEANSFLQHMVRILAGTLVDVGLGKLSPEEVGAILKNRDRTLGGKTAPPHGLYMLRTIYPDGLVEWPPDVLHA